MATFRARFQSEWTNGPMWLSAGDVVHVDSAKAVEGTLNLIVKLIVQMVHLNPNTVKGGDWTVQRRTEEWVDEE